MRKKKRERKKGKTSRDLITACSEIRWCGGVTPTVVSAALDDIEEREGKEEVEKEKEKEKKKKEKKKKEKEKEKEKENMITIKFCSHLTIL